MGFFPGGVTPIVTAFADLTGPAAAGVLACFKSQ